MSSSAVSLLQYCQHIKLGQIFQILALVVPNQRIEQSFLVYCGSCNLDLLDDHFDYLEELLANCRQHRVTAAFDFV